MKKAKKIKHSLYLIVALAMLVYALPLISFSGGWSWTSAFGVAWALFAFLVIGAHLHYLLGVDEEKQKTLDRIKAEKLRQWQLKWPEEKQRSQEHM
ncbi:hypothetical protein NYE48_06910 [Paenibacillus sp. FSL M7-1455]|jgi:hypothetical protein|uniref:2TM domain-containing protein n=1 Tax=Paenibacillus cookii TaxID=157839 RepID=A0ABQ4LY25_9BACL|nr:hypothetical protein [Paenibacillus cookii]KHF36473.1 hypothetical protein CM49_01128 [Paenibacillus sp. P1XP2]GIO68033.1 hypothetical protein J21TS3_28540 [Paenibacillus cookii]HWO55697.1 hypothetical protein [Paenibacillus cookii]